MRRLEGSSIGCGPEGTLAISRARLAGLEVAYLSGLVERMSRLYEKFILKYYRREHPELNAGASYIAWALDDGFDDMLPAMRSDIMLTRGSTVFIIDVKCYGYTTQR